MKNLRQIIILGIFVLIGTLAFACSGSGTNQVSPKETASAIKTVFAPVSPVVQAVEKAMFNYGYEPDQPIEIKPGTWKIAVRSQNARMFDEKLEYVLVESEKPKKTLIYLVLVDTAWFGRPGEPDWADSFITTVNEILLFNK